MVQGRVLTRLNIKKYCAFWGWWGCLGQALNHWQDLGHWKPKSDWDFPTGMESTTRALTGLDGLGGEKSPRLSPFKYTNYSDLTDLLSNFLFSTHLADFISMNTSPEGFWVFLLITIPRALRMPWWIHYPHSSSPISLWVAAWRHFRQLDSQRPTIFMLFVTLHNIKSNYSTLSFWFWSAYSWNSICLGIVAKS